MKPYPHFLGLTSPPLAPPSSLPCSLSFLLLFSSLSLPLSPTPRGNSAGHSSWKSANCLLFWPNYLNGLAWGTEGQGMDRRSHHKLPGWLGEGVPLAASQHSDQSHWHRISNLGRLGGENENRGVGLRQDFSVSSNVGQIILCFGDEIFL